MANDPSSFPTQMSANVEALQRLVDVVAQLRSPVGGCPWDLAQTPESLLPYILEEAYEVVEAIRSGDTTAIAEELGDLLLQVVLQSQIASEHQQFTVADVATGITEKLIRRHPHVFGDQTVESAEEVTRNWEQIKATEKGDDAKTKKLTDKLRRYTQTLPPLMASTKISVKAAESGFEWETVDGVWDKFREELAELEQAITHESPEAQESELGDLLFTVVNLARWYQLDPSRALHGTHQRLIQRLAIMESVADRPLHEYAIAELEELWQAAKAQLKAS
jgi:XTP/dITP diphosphohydrolase